MLLISLFPQININKYTLGLMYITTFRLCIVGLFLATVAPCIYMCLSMSPQCTMFVNVFAYTNTMTERTCYFFVKLRTLATAFNPFSFLRSSINLTIPMKTKLLLDTRANANATMSIVIACIIDI